MIFLSALGASLTRPRRERSVSIRKKYPLEPRVFKDRVVNVTLILKFVTVDTFQLKASGSLQTILGDPGAVSRVGRKGATKVFRYGRKSPWVLTLTELFLKNQADAGCYEKLYCVTFKRDIQEASREFIVCLF